MTSQTFTAKTYHLKVLSVIFALGSLIILIKLHNEWQGCLLSVLSFSIATIFWKVPPPKLEINDTGIIRRQHGSAGSALLSRIVLPDTECKRNWIASVSTARFNSGSFLTTLYSFEDLPDKPKYRVTIESFLFKDYVSILREIKDRAAQAHFDETTKLILGGEIDIRSVKPSCWGLLVFVVVSAFLYIYLAGKG